MRAIEAGSGPIPPLRLRERLLGLIRSGLGYPGTSWSLPIDARLSELGLSSIKMVGLMLAIEAEFKLVIPQAEITPESFASIASIEAMLERIASSQ